MSTQGIDTTTTASVKSKSTPSRPMVSTQGVTLGSTEAAFTKKYGDPTTTRSGINDYRDMKDNLDVGIDFIVFDSNGNELPNRLVFFVTASPIAQGQSWPAITGEHICNAFMPPDAKFVKIVPTVAQSAGLGIIKMYYSLSLANTLPASYFTDYNQKLVKPGNIYIEYDYANLNDSSRIQSCNIGTSPTSN